ncbi:MAG TPA: hypothetical protein PLZ32_19960 [Saprospiraceae bacterium]|nr:hypothetical protein [Saprospiraceae bacterium]
MKYHLLFFLCLITEIAFAQFNFIGNFQSNNYLDWHGKNLANPSPETLAAFDGLKGLGLDAEYLLQPDRERQFYYLGNIGADITLGNADYQKIIYPHIGLGILFYPFNMNGDCDCPSFYQEGTFFSRGLHFALKANGGLMKLTDQKGQIQGLFEANAGINIPISKTQSLAPFVGFAIGTSVKNALLEDQNKSTLNQLIFGVRYSIQ